MAGGTLDLWPLCHFLGGTVTVNVAIDIYTKIKIRAQTEHLGIIIHSPDLKKKWTFNSLKDMLQTQANDLGYFQAILGFLKPCFGFELESSSESPIGGGLGGSSSLCVTILKAFLKLGKKGFKFDQNLEKLNDIHTFVSVCHNIEAKILNTPTGTQDYYPAFSGGLNIINYYFDGVKQELIDSRNSELEKYFMLAYTGKSHHSGMNNFEVFKSAVAKNSDTIKCLESLNEVSYETVEVCRNKKWEELPRLFDLEYEWRTKLAPAFSSPEIKKLKKIAVENGALSAKICGAGGGGCVLLWVPPNAQSAVKIACENSGFKILPSKPVSFNFE